jgi:DNA-binding NarL/FixJ family response regulator
MSVPLKIAIAESSIIIRCGVEAVLKHLSDYRLQLVEITSHESLPETLRTHKPDYLIINPSFLGHLNLQSVKEESGCTNMKCIALVYTLFDNAVTRLYDGQINIFDSIDEVKNKLEYFRKGDSENDTAGDEQQTLSLREKEIVVCVVKGMTNREIADSLYLSTHTVITHRRNIARKLQIHSPSGLTIYAIMNKLVELSDIQS